MEIPSLLRQHATGVWGERGRQWLEDLPRLVEEQLETWELTLERPFPMSYHWVAGVRRADGSAAVLKIGVPDGHQDAEAQALRIFDGHGAVRLLAVDLSRGALLMERAEPGGPAAELPDEQATARIVEVGRKLHRPVPAGCTLPPLSDYAEDFAGYASDLVPQEWVTRAAGLFGELCASAPGQVVLHGDLHHDNVLRGRGGDWVAIDPHGLVGDPGFDCSTMLYNPLNHERDPALTRLVPGRIEQLADGFGLPVERVTAWGFVMAVLSEVWSATDAAAVPTRAFDVAQLLYQRV